MPTAIKPPAPSGGDAETDGISEALALLPPPSTFDFLPPLQALLSRLLLSSKSNDSASPQTTNAPEQPITPKDLTTAASTVTSMIHKARLAVNAIEGIDIAPEEQDEIIRELKEEVERGAKVLRDLQQSCRKVDEDLKKDFEEDVKMAEAN